MVDPAAAEEGGEEVAGGIGNVEKPHDEGRVGVGGGGEGRLDGDVEDVEGAEGYGCGVDCGRSVENREGRDGGGWGMNVPVSATGG